MDDYTDVIVDVANLAYRYWWPVRGSVTSKGRDNSLERGLCTGLTMLRRRFPKAQLLLAWDGQPLGQRALQSVYKAQRAAHRTQRPPDWHECLTRLLEALAAIFSTLHDEANEADVEIARYVHHQQPDRSLIVSTDRDLFILLGGSVDVLRPGQRQEVYCATDFTQEYGFEPTRFPLYKAIVGDASDNIKGVKRFPQKVAARLSTTFDTVDDLYDALHNPRLNIPGIKLTRNQHSRLQGAEARVRSNLRLVDLLADTQKPHLKQPTGDPTVLRQLLYELELSGLADALLPSAGASNGPPDVKASTPTMQAPSCKLPLIGGYEERLEEVRQNRPQEHQPQRIIPLTPRCFTDKLTFIEDGAGAQELMNFVRQRPLAFIGLDFEFRYCRPGVLVKKDHTWQDPRSIVPMLMALALVEPTADGTLKLYRFVVDVQRLEVVDPLAGIFKLPLPFVAHFGQVELFCLWQLGLPAPDRLWDTWTAERAFLLGIHHGRYQNEKPTDEVDEAGAKVKSDDEVAFNCKLVTACLSRQVPYPFAGDKERLQKSFLTHPKDQPFSQEQLEYAAADAVAAASLYHPQVQVAVEKGCLDHLTTLEMPWTVTNARMNWDGVRVDPDGCQRLRQACQQHVETLTMALKEIGLSNVNSHPQLQAFFEHLGFLSAFRLRGKYTFDDEHLKAIEDRHPSMAMIRDLRKMVRLTKDKVLSGELVGSDGRLHPEHRQLGAESGRNTMSWPNIGGIGRALRPLVVPEPGYAIGEVDLSQIEVGIAAAVYGDRNLIAMFNGRDVYTQMAKRYYAAELPPEVQTMPDKEFKKKHRQLRDRMKVFTLATIYNITPFGLSVQLNIPVERARQERDRFLEMFPSLTTALREASEFGALRGYAYLCSGLRRWRARAGAASSWEVNWMRNTPVQGSAGVVFKAAGNRLYRRYQHSNARLILPMHDAFVFEVPKQRLQEVAKLTAEVMRSTVQEAFPELEPQVDVNIEYPHCWNKDGKHRSLNLWMVKPELARRYL